VEKGLCFCHANPEKLAELGRLGGQKNRRWKGDTGLPSRPLKSVDDIRELLEETINRVRHGPFDLRAASTIGFLARIHLSALDQRVDAPEATDREASRGIYMSLFQRLGSAAPEEEIFELFPQTQLSDQTSIPAPLPGPGESIDDPPDPPNNHARVITVEIG
jgi:hypothetical protein